MLPQSVTRHIAILAVGLVLTTCTGTGNASDVSSDHSKRAVKDASANDSNDGDHGHGVHVVHLQFDYVSRPLILTVFLVAVVLIKIGQSRGELVRSCPTTAGRCWFSVVCVFVTLFVTTFV